MKRFSALTTILLIALLSSACGAQPAPTANAVDIQSTAQAAALTIIAQTQAAMPTATLPPPTEPPTQIPSPTNTPAQLPTLEVPTIAPTTSANAGADPCNTRILSGGMKGRPTRIRILNSLKIPVVVSIYLNEAAGSGSCGWGYVELAKNADVVIDSWVQGCYELWARSADGAKEKFNSYGSGCINNSDKWTFIVNKATVTFTGP
jgi:hypothetical protein